jgi:glycosyltransferase involved in cell wall biosynthesis
MKIVGFVEGASHGRGGRGLVGVPTILGGTAARGHNVALIVAGGPNTKSEKLPLRAIKSAVDGADDAGEFVIVTLSAWAVWAFSPALLWRAHKYVRAADCISLHSLYSFPVLVGYLLARLYRKPYGIWPHGVLAPFQRGVSVRKKWLYDYLVGRRILNNASVLFFSAQGEREEAAALGLKSYSVIIPDGIDVSVFAELPAKGRFRARFLAGHSGDLVVFLARLNAKKGLDLLIQAMVRVVASRPQARLAIVGSPDPSTFGRRVEDWVRESGIASHVAMTGAISHEAKLELMADADVLVMPSHAENFGFSVFEAMASCVPVVVSDTLNYAGEIARSGAGFSVPRKPESFADAILQLLEYPTLRQKMGANGIQLARRYSWVETASKVERTFESILMHRPLPADLTA